MSFLNTIDIFRFVRQQNFSKLSILASIPSSLYLFCEISYKIKKESSGLNRSLDLQMRMMVRIYQEASP